MCTEIRIYFEGDKLLRPGFEAFFHELGQLAKARRVSFRLIAGLSGDTACRDFGIAIQAHPNAWNILLRDSEGPVGAGASALLCQRYGWVRSQADSIFWMVE